MTLVLNEEQTMLQEVSRGFLQERAPLAALRALRDNRDPLGYCRDLWQAMADMGYVGITLPEAFDGIEFGYVGLGLLLQEMGKTLAASPILSTVVVSATVLVKAGSEAQKSDWLPGIAAGNYVLAFALEEGAHHRPEQTALSARAQADGFVLNGRKVFVLDGYGADGFIVLARTSSKAGETEGLSLFLVDAQAPGLQVTRTMNMDSRNAAQLDFTEVVVPAAALVGECDRAWPVVQQVLDIAQVGLAAELLGISQQVFEMTLDYLKQRQQFGVTIGSFQALQHRMAQLFCEIELCKSLVLRASQAIDEGAAGLPVLASLTKAKLCETVTTATNEAIQLHGGIGMTDEYDLGFFIKRARAVQQCFGNYHYHIDRYARLSGF